MTFGGGIFLNEQEEGGVTAYPFDFEVDETGDIRTVEGERELQKDISFNMSRTLNNFLGDRITPERENVIKGATSDVLENEQRIDEVRGISLRNGNRNTIAIRVQIIASGQEFDFVIEVSE